MSGTPAQVARADLVFDVQAVDGREIAARMKAQGLWGLA
jgi:hypothetical protein